METKPVVIDSEGNKSSLILETMNVGGGNSEFGHIRLDAFRVRLL